MTRSLKISFACLTIIILAILAGCSGTAGNNPAEPLSPIETRISDSNDRTLWGYYEIYVDPVAPSVEITALRQASMHLNALKYLETPTSTLVSLEGPLHINGDVLTVNIGLTHPFPQLIFTGFDVRGILVSRGSIDFGDGLIAPGKGDLRLLNADGYTRFWNPTDFSGSGYQDGILGTPNSVGNFNATVNGFKYFADGLGAEDSFADFTSSLRGAFTSSTKNVRRYELKVGAAGVLFNYAVDASWAMPDNKPPTVPDDFDVTKANSKEAWKLVPHFENLLTLTGGNCDVEVDVYDWQGGATIDAVTISAPQFFPGPLALGDPVDNGDYVTYSTTFSNDSGISAESHVLITATDTGASTNQYLEAFYVDHLMVLAGDVVITLAEDADFKTPGTDYEYGLKEFNFGTAASPIDYTDLDGPWDFTDITYTDSDHRTVFDTTDDEVSGFVNDFPPDVEYFLREGTDNGMFRAEEHNEASDSLYLYGVYYPGDFGAIVFDTPGAFQYPMDINTDTTVQKSVVIIPFLLTIVFEYRTVAIGQGWTKVPYDGGTWHNCLLTRATLEMNSSGAMGEGWLGTALQYEWLADDGTCVAMLMSANAVDNDPNFDDVTFEFIGSGDFLALQDITTF